MQVVRDHIPGSDNVGPDALSRGWMDKALQRMRDAGTDSLTRLELGKRWGCWLEDLVGAGEDVC